MIPGDKKENQIFEILFSDEIKQAYENYYKHLVFRNNNESLNNSPKNNFNKNTLHHNMNLKEIASQNFTEIEILFKKILMNIIKNPSKIKKKATIKK